MCSDGNFVLLTSHFCESDKHKILNRPCAKIGDDALARDGITEEIKFHQIWIMI